MNATQAGISAAKLRHEAAYHERRARQSTGKLAEFYDERAQAYNATAAALEKILVAKLTPPAPDRADDLDSALDEIPTANTEAHVEPTKEAIT